MNPRPVPCVRRGMLTFSLGKHLIHALAFSPDGARLAVACGYRVAALDWQAPGEPVWHEPFQLSGPPESLGFRPDGPGVLVGYQNIRSYRGNPVYELDPLAGGIVERLPLTNSPRVSWATHMPVVVAWSDPPAVIALGYLAFPNPWHALVVPVVGGPPVARLG